MKQENTDENTRLWKGKASVCVCERGGGVAQLAAVCAIILPQAQRSIVSPRICRVHRSGCTTTHTCRHTNTCKHGAAEQPEQKLQKAESFPRRKHAT